MRIAFVYDCVHPWEKGGAQKRVWELARRLADDHEVHLYGMHYWDGPAVMEKEDVTFHGVCRPYDLYTDGRRAIPPAIKFAGHLAPALLKEDFDVVDCQQFPYFPVFTSKAHELFRDSTLVVTWYELWGDYWDEYLGWKGVFGKTVEQATFRLPDHVVPISGFMEADLRAAGRTDGVTVVENGVDYDAIQCIKPLDEEWDVVYVGRLSEHKRVGTLLEAVDIASEAIGSPVETCIVGDGPERDRLEREARELGVDDHVTFKGFVEADEDVIGTLKAATVFVLPSTREGFPNTILEANACGVPSIVVEHPENGSTAVVEDGETGFVTQPNASAVADRIVEVLTDEDIREHLSASARAFGEAHDWDVIVDELEAVYLEAVD
jgi:glycosyltransferase involved in cell wall biosynthesis